MTVLALDQSSKITGYAIFIDGALNHSGTINLADSDLGTRLMQLREQITTFITDWHVDYVIYEDIQLQDVQGSKEVGIKTFKILAEVLGNVEELLTELRIPHEAVLAITWKSVVGIKGQKRPEQKKNAQLYVKTNYGLDVSEDESDAICIGTYYIIHTRQNDAYDWSD